MDATFEIKMLSRIFAANKVRAAIIFHGLAWLIELFGVGIQALTHVGPTCINEMDDSRVNHRWISSCAKTALNELMTKRVVGHSAGMISEKLKRH